MEEIAFTFVSKPYEEWDFYSDSSANDQMQCTDSELYQLLPYKTLDPAMDDQLHNEKLETLSENDVDKFILWCLTRDPIYLEHGI